MREHQQRKQPRHPGQDHYREQSAMPPAPLACPGRSRPMVGTWDRERRGEVAHRGGGVTDGRVGSGTGRGGIGHPGGGDRGVGRQRRPVTSWTRACGTADTERASGRPSRRRPGLSPLAARLRRGAGRAARKTLVVGSAPGMKSTGIVGRWPSIGPVIIMALAGPRRARLVGHWLDTTIDARAQQPPALCLQVSRGERPRVIQQVLGRPLRWVVGDG